MFGVGGTGERQHSNSASESEDDLRRGGVGLGGKSADSPMPQDFHVRGEQRKSLVDDVVFATEGAHFAVPAKASIASVLDKGRRFRMGPGYLLQLGKRDVADAEKACASGISFFDHGLPGFKIVGGPVGVRSGAMENKAVDVVRAKMFERAGH